MAVVNFVELPGHRVSESFDAAVRRGLGAERRTLPSRFFYDAVGSAIFERIMDLPEYYLTRCETEILSQYAAEIVACVGDDLTLIEFGSGNSAKTRLLIDAAMSGPGRLHYVPVDISGESLRVSTAELAREYGDLSITAFAAEYNDAIPHLPRHESPRLFLFMGSNIGNFETREAVEFVATVRRHMAPADRLLVGYDCAKPAAILEAAYNDSAGVTAEFNRNILRRINSELGGTFDLNQFGHRAPFVAEQSRVEMHLVSRTRQQVRVCALDEVYRFEKGETIHTENSHKYTAGGIEAIAASAELRVARTWTDRSAWFAVSLLEPSG